MAVGRHSVESTLGEAPSSRVWGRAESDLSLRAEQLAAPTRRSTAIQLAKMDFRIALSWTTGRLSQLSSNQRKSVHFEKLKRGDHRPRDADFNRIQAPTKRFRVRVPHD